MPVPVDRTLRFSDAELTRIREACRALNTSYVEFLHHAAMQAVDEVLGISAELAQHNGHRDGVRIAGQ